MYINNPGHMIKMAAMPIQGKKPSKIFSSGIAEPIAMKLDIINHDHVMTLTKFKARST